MYIYKAPNQISKITFYGVTNVAHIPSAIYFSMKNTNGTLSEAEVLTSVTNNTQHVYYYYSVV